MPKIADRVQETTTTTGTGTVTLDGAKTGYQSFSSAFSNADKVYYCIEDGTNWEVGVGTFTTAGTTLSRDTIFASSNAGSAVNFGAGDKNVFCTAPSQAVGGVPVISNKTGAYTVVASDNGKIINCTSGTFTVSLTAAATLGAGFNCWIWNTSTTDTNTITIDPNGSETVDGFGSISLRCGEGVQLICDGTAWKASAQRESVLYSENASGAVTRPVATGDRAIAIGTSATASNQYSVAIGRNSSASGVNSVVLGVNQVASSNYASSIGSNSGGSGSQAVTGAGAMSLGGSYASGADSFAAAIANNTSSYGATGAGAIAIGATNKASNTRALAIAGINNIASGVSSACIGGYACTASGNYSYALGYECQATADYGWALGRQALSSLYGKRSYASGQFAAAGDAQNAIMVLRRATTDATPTVITSDGAAASTTNQLVLPNSSAYAFDGIIVARRQAAGGTESAAWKVEGLIRREGSAATTTLVASTVTAISNAPGWTLALSADTTNGGLSVTFTGTAATNIRTVATLRTSEVTYA